MSVVLRIYAGHTPTAELAGRTVRVDRRPVGVVSGEATTELTMEPGFHVVEVDRCTPLRVHARPGHEVELVVHMEHPGAIGLFAGGFFSLVEERPVG